MPANEIWRDVSFNVSAAARVHKLQVEFLYLDGAISVNRDFSVEVTRRLQTAWACLGRCKMKTYDRPVVLLPLKM